jgi:hypothetical protein
MEYKFNKEYFVSNDSDEVVFGKNTILVDFSSNLSQKVLGKIYNLGKPYVSLDIDEVVVPEKEIVKKYTSKIKTKKKVKIDEPKKTTEYTTDEEES